MILWAALVGQTAQAGTYGDCAQAVQNGDQAKAKGLSSGLLGFNSFSAAEQVAGAACLTFAMDKDYVFSFVLNTFVTKDDEIAAIHQITKQKAESAAGVELQKAKEDENARFLEELALEAAVAKQVQTKKVWRQVYLSCSAL